MDASEALTLWVAEGHLDEPTAHRLRSVLDSHEVPAKQNKIIGVLVSVGAVLIGGGLLLFIASQWGASSPTGRLLLLFGSWALAVVGAVVAGRQQLDITSHGLWFLSSIAVGVNIFLVGQIFNLPLNYWQGTFLWMIATLAAGWAAPSSAQGWLAVPLGILTLGWLTTPNSWFGEQWAFLWDPASIKPLLPMIGLALIAISILTSNTEFSWLRRPAIAFGSLLVAVPLTVSTFHPDAFAWIFEIDFGIFHLLVVLGALAVVLVAWQRRPDSPLLAGFVAVAVLLVVLLPQTSNTSSLGSGGDTAPWLAQLLDDHSLLFWIYAAVIFGLSMAAIVAGQHFSIRGLVNVGFSMVCLQLFALYIGRIAGALPTSLAVIAGGLLLVGGAIFMERKRRELTSASPLEVTQ